MSKERISSNTSISSTQPPNSFYSVSIEPPAPCKKAECKKVCICFSDCSSFKPPTNFLKNETPISFSYDMGRVRMTGLEKEEIKKWKHLVALGARSQCSIKNDFADWSKNISYDRIDFNTSDPVRIIKIPAYIFITKYAEQENRNSLASTTFYNPTCHAKDFKMKAASEAIQDIYIDEPATKVYQAKIKLETQTINMLLPRGFYSVQISVDRNTSSVINFKLSQDNTQSIDTLIYYAEKSRAMIKGKHIAKLQIRADYHTYRIKVGFIAMLEGSFALVKDNACEPERKVINIKELTQLKTWYNISQEISVDTPGNVTAEYSFCEISYKGDKPKGEPVNVIKSHQGDSCNSKVPPAPKNCEQK